MALKLELALHCMAPINLAGNQTNEIPPAGFGNLYGSGGFGDLDLEGEIRPRGYWAYIFNPYETYGPIRNVWGHESSQGV